MLMNVSVALDAPIKAHAALAETLRIAQLNLQLIFI
jgi:hypothetical protein